MNEMLTDDGYFNLKWLNDQSTERLRYEARCERQGNWQYAQRHTLLLILAQVRVAPLNSFGKVKTDGTN
jgi:hypothetical protein